MSVKPVSGNQRLPRGPCDQAKWRTMICADRLGQLKKTTKKELRKNRRKYITTVVKLTNWLVNMDTVPVSKSPKGSHKASLDSNSKTNSDSDREVTEDQDVLQEQKSRSILRERFLRALKALYDKPASFTMHERTRVKAIFRATDIETENFQVSELQTPIGVVPEALLRSSDVLYFTVQLNQNGESVSADASS